MVDVDVRVSSHLKEVLPWAADKRLRAIITIMLFKKQLSRLTVVSREAKKKQHAHASSGLRDHYSELFTRMAALKF